MVLTKKQQTVERLDRWLYYSLCGLALSLFTTVAGSSIFLGLSIFLFFIRVFLRRDDLWESFKTYRYLVYAYGAFVLAMLVSALFSGDIRRGVGLVVSRQGYYVMPCMIIMAIMRDKDKLIMLAKLTILSLLANNLYMFGKAWTLYGKTIRIEGLVGLMPLSMVFSVAIPVLYLGAAHFRGPWRWICFFLGVSCVAAELLTGTRGAWLASAAALFVIASLYTKNKKNLLVGILVAAVGMAGIFAVSPQLKARFMTIGNVHSENSITERFSMWHSALNVWKDYPVLGIGVGQYEKAYQTQYCLPDSKDYKRPPENRHGHPHNNFLLILSEGGAVSAIAFLAFLGSLIWISLHGWRQTDNVLYLVLLSILLGMQLHGITDTNMKMTVPSKAFWFLTGLTLQMIWVQAGGHLPRRRVA